MKKTKAKDKELSAELKALNKKLKGQKTVAGVRGAIDKEIRKKPARA